MSLTPEQIFIVSAIATALVWLITFVYMKLLGQPKPSQVILKVIAFVASVALAYFWTPFQLPDPSVDIWVFITALLVVATAVFKLAQLIYDIIWDRLIELIAKIPVFKFVSTKR